MRPRSGSTLTARWSAASKPATDNSRNTEAAANVSVQNNLPNADAGAQPTGSQEQKQEETTNYEIGKTVRTLVREQPQLRRISLAVMVDGVASRGADGTVAWAERPPEELARIATLVRSAIGYNEARGDRVDVVSHAVRRSRGSRRTRPAAPFWSRLDKADLFRLAENWLVALAVLAALLFVLRPMALRVSLRRQAGRSPEPPTTALPPAEGAARPGNGTEEMVQVANIEGAMRDRLDPTVSPPSSTNAVDESVAMLRSWLAEAI